MRNQVMISGAVLVVLGVAPDLGSAPRIEICEEWRDYYYNVETGVFIEWIGDPYWICFSIDDFNEPTSRPDPGSDDYAGGWGTPRDPKKPTCHQCSQEAVACNDSVARGYDLCIDHFQGLARRWCTREERSNGNRPIKGDYECRTEEIDNGKPTKVCWGEGIDECVHSYQIDHPERTHEDGLSIEINIKDVFKVGGSHTTSVTWGGSQGFENGCKEAEAIASGVCLANQHTCEEKAGGCR